MGVHCPRGVAGRPNIASLPCRSTTRASSVDSRVTSRGQSTRTNSSAPRARLGPGPCSSHPRRTMGYRIRAWWEFALAMCRASPRVRIRLVGGDDETSARLARSEGSPVRAAGPASVHGVRTSSVGWLRCHLVASWYAAAKPRTSQSLPRPAATCRPTGRPSGVGRHGTEIAGCPVVLKQ